LSYIEYNRYTASLIFFSCINFATGYYNYHSKDEYVIIEDVFNSLEIGKKMISDLGYKKYHQEIEKRKFYL
jgi:acetylornithine deacetylase/succinyl-diaminopimelate desuccinylase-like protein